MHSVDPQSRETTGQRIDKEPFKAATAPKTRNQLRSELGSTYEVISTNFCLVVQHRGAASTGQNHLNDRNDPFSAT